MLTMSDSGTLGHFPFLVIMAARDLRHAIIEESADDGVGLIQPRRDLPVNSYAFQALWMVLAPQTSPRFSTTWFFHSGTLMALINRLASTQKPARDPLAGVSSVAAALMCFPV